MKYLVTYINSWGSRAAPKQDVSMEFKTLKEAKDYIKLLGLNSFICDINLWRKL